MTQKVKRYVKENEAYPIFLRYARITSAAAVSAVLNIIRKVNYPKE